MYLCDDVDAQALQEFPAVHGRGRFSVGDAPDSPAPHEPLLTLCSGQVKLQHEAVHGIRSLVFHGVDIERRRYERTPGHEKRGQPAFTSASVRTPADAISKTLPRRGPILRFPCRKSAVRVADEVPLRCRLVTPSR